MLPFFLIPLALQAAQGIENAISGGSQARKAKRAQEDLLKNRPQYQVPQGELDMLSLLGNRASQGLSESTLNKYGQLAERGLTSRLDAIIKGGGNPNNIGSAYQDYLTGIDALTLANERAQLQNVDNYLQQNRRISDYQDKQWNLNQYAPWADKLAAAAQERTLGESRQQKGFSEIGSSIGNYFGQLNQKQDMNNVYGQDTNWLGQPVNRSYSGNNNTSMVGSSPTMTNQQFGNTLTGATMGLNNNYFGYSPNSFYNGPAWAPLMAGYNMSNLKPSDRASLMYMIGGQFS